MHGEHVHDAWRANERHGDIEIHILVTLQRTSSLLQSAAYLAGSVGKPCLDEIFDLKLAALLDELIGFVVSDKKLLDQVNKVPETCWTSLVWARL